MKLEGQRDILFSRIEEIPDEKIFKIGEKYFRVNDAITDIAIHNAKCRLYSAVYFGEVNFDEIIKEYEL